MFLDTNTFIWFVNGHPRLKPSLQAAIADPNMPISVSVVTFWEITIKHRKGKLPMPEPFASAPSETFASWCFRAVIDILPIEQAQIALAMRLEFPHDDPFDRLIAAAAISKDQPLVSSDAQFKRCAGLEVLLV